MCYSVCIVCVGISEINVSVALCSHWEPIGRYRAGPKHVELRDGELGVGMSPS